jgi:hypothetical protein
VWIFNDIFPVTFGKPSAVISSNISTDLFLSFPSANPVTPLLSHSILSLCPGILFSFLL